MKKVFTGLLIALLIVVNMIYQKVGQIVESAVAVSQAQDDILSYAIARELAYGNLIGYFNLAVVLLIVALWYKTVYKTIKERVRR